MKEMNLFVALATNVLTFTRGDSIADRKKKAEDKTYIRSLTFKRNERGPYPSFEGEIYRFMSEVFSEYVWERTVKLDCMRNPETKRKLELDVYCPALKLAVEMQGQYHTVRSRHFHRRESLEKIQHRDRLKKALCRKNGIRLICVPYDIHRDSLHDFLLYEVGKKCLSV